MTSFSKNSKQKAVPKNEGRDYYRILLFIVSAMILICCAILVVHGDNMQEILSVNQLLGIIGMMLFLPLLKPKENV